LVLPVKKYYTEFANQGGVKYKHGHVFFDDWQIDEWNRFYWFIIECVQQYLKDGLIECNMDEIKKNRLKVVCAKKFDSDDLAEDFVKWMYQKKPEDFKEFQLGELKIEFGTEIDNRIFSTCLNAFFDLNGYKVSKTRKRIGENQVTVWRSVQSVQPNPYCSI
jgi:hypothetical protein